MVVETLAGDGVQRHVERVAREFAALVLLCNLSLLEHRLKLYDALLGFSLILARLVVLCIFCKITKTFCKFELLCNLLTTNTLQVFELSF